MSKIMDYSFLFEKMFGGEGIMSTGRFRLGDIGSKSVQSQLKAVGIDTNSAQYKAVVNKLKSRGNGMAYVNIQGIKNQMMRYDRDGDYVDPVTGLAGLEVNEKTIASKSKIIDIPESSREEMFQLTKKEFLRENGVANGDATKRSEVYMNLYRKMNKKSRLAAGNTLQQYEREYTRAFVGAIRSVKPEWKVGQDIPKGVLDSITRSDIESKGVNLKSVDMKI